MTNEQRMIVSSLRAQGMGFAGVTLGRRILRAETAAIVFCGAVMFSLGEWEA